MEKRGIGYDKLPIAAHWYDSAAGKSKYRLIFNRMSPSAYLRGLSSAIFYTQSYVAHLESIGARINYIRARRERMVLPTLLFGVAGYSIVRDTDEEAQAERKRITDVREGSPGYHNCQ